MKFDQKTNHISEENMAHIKKSLNISGNKYVFLAGSTHPGEETILLESFVRLQSDFSDLVLIIAPRNPDRADEICRMASDFDLMVKKMSQDKPGSPQVVVVDFMGVLGKLYAIADVAFVGGSLVDFGGHNPLEPAAFAKPILFGPDMSDFPEISRMLLCAGGSMEVKNIEQLYYVVKEILTDSVKSREMGIKAFEVFQANQGAVEKTVSVIKKLA